MFSSLQNLRVLILRVGLLTCSTLLQIEMAESSLPVIEFGKTNILVWWKVF